MEWLRVKIEYFSDNLELSKEKIVNVFSDLGVHELEFLDYFSENSLDFHKEKMTSSTWEITGYFPDNRFINLKLKMISDKMEEISETEEIIYNIYTSKCNEDDWKNEWKKYFHTTKITDKIVIKPSWEEYEPKDGEIIVKIDPGMAFGTGTHETTSLCIKMLEKYVNKEQNLLDIGCGSGILMVIGSKLGVKTVDGIDIDSNVKEVAEKNLLDNDVKNYNVVIGNLVDDINEKYDIVVSNILADTLIELLTDIEKVLKSGAKVIFSGIL
ncbi:MAG: 50S ribosomal protein L11 methyltransferase, partial [Sebaldella sp.]|nr:50S ribosomal protein L11 methyltransferase [Sebaldella sp.]